jgi:hypothetical protein
MDTRRIVHDAPRNDHPAGEELVTAEHALEWFEAWEEHAPGECAFGSEHMVMKELRRAITLAWEAA